MARSSQYPPSVKPGIPKLPPLPSGWSYALFGDLLDVAKRPAALEDATEYQLVTAKRSRGGIVPRERLMGAEIKTKTQFFCEADDFLISRRQIIHGACGVVPRSLSGAVVSNEYSTLRVNGRLLLPYLEALAHTVYFQQTCFQSSIGVDVEKMIFKLDEWLKYQVPLPPLREQKKIAAILSSVDEAIQATQAVIEQTRRVKEGLLQDLLTKGIGHTRFKQTEIGEIPEGWDLCSLSALLVDGPRNGVYKSAEEIGTGTIIVGQTAFTSERGVDFTATRRAVSTQDDLAKYGLKDGDILITRVYATPEGCGRPVLVTGVPEPAIYESNMMRLRVDETTMRPAFLFSWLLKPVVRRYLMARASSSNQTSINQTTLGGLPCAVPSLKEQDRIMAAVEGAGRATADGIRQLASLDVAKAGLLHDLLTGKVRVSV